MAPIKRPLKDPNQFYAYVWRFKGEVIWVGHGHNHRGRPIRCNTTGRPPKLVELLRRKWRKISYEVFPCESRELAIQKEIELTISLAPRYNTAIGFAGFAGHKHNSESIEKIRESSIGRPASELCKLKSSQRASERNRLNPPRKGKTCSEEHRRKLSEARKLYHQRIREERDALQIQKRK